MTAKPAQNTNAAQRRKILKIIAASPVIVLMSSKRAFATEYADNNGEYCSDRNEPLGCDNGVPREGFAGKKQKGHEWNGKGHGHHRSHGKGHDHDSSGGYDDDWEGYGEWDHDD